MESLNSLSNQLPLSVFRRIGYIVFVAIFMGAVFAYCTHTERTTVIIGRVDMQQYISSSDGYTSTEYDCKVYTDNGIFRIVQHGVMFPHPELISRIHEGDTLAIVSKGFDLPVIGQYRIIVAVED